MTILTIQQTTGHVGRSLFNEVEKRWQAAREKAFDLFEKRGCQVGRELEDWLAAEKMTMGDCITEIVDQDGKFELQVALPGFGPNDVQVITKPGEIAIYAEILSQRNEREAEELSAEFELTEVYRRFEIPPSVDLEKATAVMYDGILHIAAPKAAKTGG